MDVGVSRLLADRGDEAWGRVFDAATEIAGQAMGISLHDISVNFASDADADYESVQLFFENYADFEDGAANRSDSYNIVTLRCGDITKVFYDILKLLGDDEQIETDSIKRWNGDDQAKRYTSKREPTRCLIRHEKPFCGLTICDAAKRTILYLKSETQGNYVHLEHLTKYPIRVFLRIRGCAILHAAACVLDGRGFLMVGEKAAGKSTLVMRFMEAGAKLIGNDFCYLERSGQNLDMLAFPHMTRLSRETIRDNEKIAPYFDFDLDRLRGYRSGWVYNGGKYEFYSRYLREIFGPDCMTSGHAVDVILWPRFDEKLVESTLSEIDATRHGNRLLRQFAEDKPLPDWMPLVPYRELARIDAENARWIAQIAGIGWDLPFGPVGCNPVYEAARI